MLPQWAFGYAKNCSPITLWMGTACLICPFIIWILAMVLQLFQAPSLT